LDRIIERAADNLTIAKLLIQLGIDPNNVTFDTIFNRLVEIALANIKIVNFIALIAAIFYVATLLMRTIVPLRVFAIISDVFFIGYGLLANSITTLLLYILLLPINCIRLYQMVRLVKRARTAAQGDLSMEWLKTFMSPRKYRKGELLCRKGEPANEMFITVSGKF